MEQETGVNYSTDWCADLFIFERYEKHNEEAITST